MDISDEVWSKNWVDNTMNGFNIPNEPEWDRCDCCRVMTHIHVAKWVVFDNNIVLMCKKCQNEN
jgi:hypothetical protein